MDPSLDLFYKSYLKRITHDIDIQLRFFKNDKDLLKTLHNISYICLDPNGKQHTSESFCHFLFDHLESKPLNLVIGGAMGLPEICKKAPLISLSKLTLPHQLATLICFEQIYRALTISKKMPYHK